MDMFVEGMSRVDRGSWARQEGGIRERAITGTRRILPLVSCTSKAPSGHISKKSGRERVLSASFLVPAQELRHQYLFPFHSGSRFFVYLWQNGPHGIREENPA
jgi:hypothetical protein